MSKITKADVKTLAQRVIDKKGRDPGMELVRAALIAQGGLDPPPGCIISKLSDDRCEAVYEALKSSLEMDDGSPKLQFEAALAYYICCLNPVMFIRRQRKL